MTRQLCPPFVGLFWEEVTMANKTLFSSIKSKLPRTDSYNEAGGRAYKFTPKHALAQMAATGCFNGVYYASAESKLDDVRLAAETSLIELRKQEFYRSAMHAIFTAIKLGPK
jgi:hypothetical protein